MHTLVDDDLYYDWIYFWNNVSIRFKVRKKMYTLIVVDMQETFHASTRDRVRKNCLREVTQAVKDDAHIIFLEYRHSGPTLPELTQALHTKCFFKEKAEDDGSAEVESTVLLNKLPKHFKVCGVNTDCCVYATVRGLTARFPMANIEVIEDACDSDWHHSNGVNKMVALKGNVQVREMNPCGSHPSE